mmetsp:Transcript_7204/g.9388  ORF Transcript_7204/g.9388 Transcript_7204/m.9388 type:complete len:355 (+) Transcript_7204:102-1166(+)
MEIVPRKHRTTLTILAMLFNILIRQVLGSSLPSNPAKQSLFQFGKAGPMLSSNSGRIESDQNDNIVIKQNYPQFNFDSFTTHINIVNSTEDLRFVKEVLCHAAVLGLDTETKPRFRRSDPQPPVSILQISARTKEKWEGVFVIDLLTLLPHCERELDNCLMEVFLDPSIPKVGRDFKEDLKELFLAYPTSQCFHRMAGYLEICRLNRELDPQQRKVVGLKRLVESHLEQTLSKGRISRSDWGKRPLAAKQVHYAVCDALVLIKLYDKIFQDLLNQPPKPKSKKGKKSHHHKDPTQHLLQTLKANHCPFCNVPMGKGNQLMDHLSICKAKIARDEIKEMEWLKHKQKSEQNHANR